MKSFLTTLFTVLLFQSLTANTTVRGIVIDAENGEALAGATLTFEKSADFQLYAISNDKGEFTTSLSPGTYSIEVTLKGYTLHKIFRFLVGTNMIDTLHIMLSRKDNPALSSRDSSYHHRVLSEMRKISESSAHSESPKKDAESADYHHDITTTKPTTSPFDPASYDEVLPDKSAPTLKKESGEDYTIIYDPETYEERIEIVRKDRSEDVRSSKIELELLSGSLATTSIKPKPQPEKKPGQLTAGEWRDLDHWTFWNDLMKDPYFRKMQDYWKYYPGDRFSVYFNDENEQPLPDITVELKNRSGSTVWTARTDNTGKAELWGNFYGGEETQFRLSVSHQGKNYPFAPSLYEQGQNIFKLPVDCLQRHQVDIAFVVDATGSMSDELEFLKAEMKDVIRQASIENEFIDIRTSALFYRDKGDDYLTRSIAFNNDITNTLAFIKMQAAGGGGDTPEAVHTALEKAVYELDWRDEALSRILFLLLDAPPHYNSAVLDSLQQTILAAAEKGIKIIPITGSGIDKESEFLMKFFALATNGTYVFLTNHSGIGGHHIEATAGDHNIEPLNDLMVRLILENTHFISCKKEALPYAVTLETPKDQHLTSQTVKGLGFGLSYYPNPATDRLYIQLEAPIDRMTINDTGGRAIKRLGPLPEGLTGIDLSSLGAGTYVLQCMVGDQVAAEQLVVVRP